MKKILITQRLKEHSDYFEEQEALDISWGELFNEIGFLPIVLPYEYDFKNYFREFKIDGILLTGGNDLSLFHRSRLSEKRDDFELKLIDAAIKNSIPIFGVCRGMQIIAHYFKSSFKSVENQVNTKHTLVVNQSSKYAKYLNMIEEVNSFHNFAVESVSEEFLISASDKNGVIKAIEHKKYKIFAQMWHSERVHPFNAEELELMKVFFND